MTTENEKKKNYGNPALADAKFEPATASSTPAPRGIPVAVLRFAKPLQVPGRAVTPVLETEELKNRRRWEIEFIPQLRHFRISYFAPDTKEPKVTMIHETKVDTWDPIA